MKIYVRIVNDGEVTAEFEVEGSFACQNGSYTIIFEHETQKSTYEIMGDCVTLKRTNSPIKEMIFDPMKPQIAKILTVHGVFELEIRTRMVMNSLKRSGGSLAVIYDINATVSNEILIRVK